MFRAPLENVRTATTGYYFCIRIHVCVCVCIDKSAGKYIFRHAIIHTRMSVFQCGSAWYHVEYKLLLYTEHLSVSVLYTANGGHFIGKRSFLAYTYIIYVCIVYRQDIDENIIEIDDAHTRVYKKLNFYYCTSATAIYTINIFNLKY